MDRPEATLAASLDAAAGLAFDRLGRYEANIQIAGHTIRLVFAGEVLHSQAMRAFSHIEAPLLVPPSLEVFVWDTVHSGVAMSSKAGAQIEIAAGKSPAT